MIFKLSESLRTVSVFAVSLSLLLVAGCTDAPGTAPQMPPPMVDVVTLKTESVTLQRELPGRTSAYLIAEVRPQVTGIVRERLFEEGSQVEAGQALYQLDDATYRAAFESARAALARAEAALEIAQLNAGRAEKLILTDAISDQDLQSLRAARRQAEADVAVAKAQLETARVRLDYARVGSPIAGRVGKSSVTPGALVTENQSAVLTTVQQLDPIYVDVTQSASELLSLRQQLSAGKLAQADDIPATILLPDGTRYSHDGTLTFEDAAVDPTTGSVAIRIVVPNPERLLMPGMYVRAVISTAIVDNALLVPQRGVTRDPRGRAVAMVLTTDGIVERREIEVGESIGENWLVSDGLAAGDRVITEGLQKIRPGQPAQVAAAGGGAQ